MAGSFVIPFFRKNQKDLSKVITQVLFEIAEISADVDIQRDSIAIENLREYTDIPRIFAEADAAICRYKPYWFEPI